MKKPARTISGVAPVAVMIPPKPCKHGTCLYCPALNAPQSYTPESPVVMRAKIVGYDSFKQVSDRLDALKKMGHSTDKVELIIMGGTFLNHPVEFQYNFVKGCYDALNGMKSKSLEEAKVANEKAKNRCVALCIETRPDFCSDEEIKRILEFGCTRVELGVQAIDDKIYLKVNRGHTVQEVIDATRRLKEAGFKVGYHLMPGLPDSNLKKDLTMFKKIFSEEKYRPDQIKIYPCQVIKGSGLEKLYSSGKYKPYTKEETEILILKMYSRIPRYCRVMRVMREIPKNYLVAGLTNMDLRNNVEGKIRKEGLKINEIRFREIGFVLTKNLEVSEKLDKKITKYKASGGEEFFIEIINKENILFGLLRLRIDKRGAMVRELHVYGPSVGLGIRDKEKYQHTGLGKDLMKEAEKIAKKSKQKKIRVISGVGVREYYKRLGYILDKEGYMGKDL